MRRRGFTLIELIVAITLFIIVVTLSLGAFAAIAHTKSSLGDMKETQQKIRLISEELTRYAKEADAVSVDQVDGSTVMFSYIESGSVFNDRIFTLSGKSVDGLEYSDMTSYNCDVTSGYVSGVADYSKCSKEDLLTSSTGTKYVVKRIFGVTGVPITGAIFTQGNTVPSTLGVNFILENTSQSFALSNDSVTYQDQIILENLQ